MKVDISIGKKEKTLYRVDKGQYLLILKEKETVSLVNYEMVSFSL